MGDQVDDAATLSQSPQRFRGVIPHRDAGEDLFDAGLEELFNFFPGLVEGLFHVVGRLLDGLAEIGAGGLQPDVVLAIIVIGEHAIYVKAENELPDCWHLP